MSKKTCFAYNQRLYELWLEYSDQYQVVEQCLQQHLPASIHKLFPKVDDKRFNILSIGAGNGSVDVQILKIVVECLEREDVRHEIEICNAAIEPNTAQIQRYKDLIQETAQSFQKSSKNVIYFDLKNKTFEEYQRSTHENNRFDVIHGVYSFGFLNDPKSALKLCYENELKNTGFIAVIMANGESDDVFQKVASVLSKHRAEGQGRGQEQTWPSVSKLIDHATFNYEQIPFSSTLDVTEIFHENFENSSLLLDLITCENNFCQTADKRVVDEVRLLLRELAHENSKGRFVIKIHNELILIHKSS